MEENELKVLSNLVSGYFDFAEIQAMRKNMMYMRDYIEHLDKILASTGEEVLENAGSISHKQAMEKAVAEYRKYQEATLFRLLTMDMEKVAGWKNITGVR